MPYYFVQGKAEFTYHDDCPDCGRDHEKTVDFTAVVQGDSPEDAAEAALQAQSLAGDGHCHKAEWVRPPDVAPLPEDRAMRLAGAPTLPGFEEV
jgi:hypothetical protein